MGTGQSAIQRRAEGGKKKRGKQREENVTTTDVGRVKRENTTT